MKFLTNKPDHRKRKLSGFVMRRGNETQEQANRRYMEWLQGKIIGEPQATETYTVEQLKAMDIIGIYEP